VFARSTAERADEVTFKGCKCCLQPTVELNDNGISLEVGLGVAEQMLLNKPNLDMNKDSVREDWSV